MGITSGQYTELVLALLLGIILFVAVFRLPEKATIALLLVLLPIQFIDSRYGTSNTVLTYLVAFSFLLQGRLRMAPILIPVLLLLFSYALSFSISHPAARLHHVFYIIGFCSNILLFYMVYNFIVRTGDWKFVLYALAFTNLIVLAACFAELTLGESQLRLFGLEEWSIRAGRASAGRIVGPFGSTHTTADYLVSQTMLLAYMLIYTEEKRMKLFIVALIAGNCMILVATGDRGGFVGLVVGTLCFLFLFRIVIGVAQSVKYLIIGCVLFVAASVMVVNYTNFGVLFDRLEATDMESGIEDTRGRGFRNGMSYFEQSPILGLGPKLSVSNKSRLVPDIPYRPYPHILVMHILATLGIVGFIAWLIFFVAILNRLLGSARCRSPDEMLNMLPKVGILLFALFMAGELRIEFLRVSFLDYQNYMFVLFGWLIASAELLRRQSGQSNNRPIVAKPLRRQG